MINYQYVFGFNKNFRQKANSLHQRNFNQRFSDEFKGNRI